MRLNHRFPRMAPRQQVRSFHQTRPAPFINEVIDGASAFVHGVHDVSHLPWAYSLPLTALLVRMGVALPLQIFTKVQARKDSDLAPILMAWRSQYQKEALAAASADGKKLRSQATREVTTKLKAKHAELRRRWGIVRFWKPANFLQIPVWIAIMESIRAMSGNKNGLVPYLLSLVRPDESGSNALNLAVEPSLATEGALWFPDLLAGDPTGALPALLSVSILVNVRNGWKGPKLREMADLPRLELAKQLSWFSLRALIQVLALNVGVASYMYQMPTALMVYWITSTNIATAQTFLLQKYMFPTPSLKPWKPVHIGFSEKGKQAIAHK
ncbi:hypothetical protein BDV18DRAFT_100771 [Aspergillus unguis]